MQLLEKLDDLKAQNDDIPSEKVLYHELNDELRKLNALGTGRQLLKTELYKALESQLNAIVYGYEYGSFTEDNFTNNNSYLRAILWPLDQGRYYDGILETLRNRALVSKADIYFFPGVDLGMARSGNHNVVRDLAIELGYNYFFATSYLNLNVDNLPDKSLPQNRLGLEGNAIMTRFPITNLRTIPLDYRHDTVIQGINKLGQEKAVVADLMIARDRKLTVSCMNFPVFSSARGRAHRLKHILQKLKPNDRLTPVLVGGDFQSHTYNCSSPFSLFLSVLNKIYRGLDYIIQEHQVHPDRYFERALFKIFQEFKFDHKDLNEMGVGNVHKSLLNLAPMQGFFRDALVRLLKSRTEIVTFKQDWFFGSESIQESHAHQSERPKVITHLFHNGKSVSSHDPVLLDFEVVAPT